MTISLITNLQYADAANTAIMCQATISGEPGTHPCVLSSEDNDTRTMFVAAISGKYGPIASYVAPITPLSTYAALAAKAVSDAATSIVSQIMPDPAHQAAFQNAAAILNGNGGNPPASGPLYSAFNALAGAYGMTAASFASTVIGAQAASMSLAAHVADFNSANGKAANTADIAAAINQFETEIGLLVTSLNSSLPVPITAPTAIAITGINK
jgi:hypothetical protein